MEYRPLGDTGLTVSRIGFGGAVLGITNYLTEYDANRPEDAARSRDALAAALDQGITLFDTAPAYGAGASESLVGDVIGNRDDVVVSSKYALWQQETPAESVEASLRRLKRERIDLIQFHGLSYSEEQAERIMAAGGLLEQLEALRDQGKIGHIGFTSEDNNPPVYRFIRSGRFATAQLCVNLLYNHPYEPRRPFGSLLEAHEAGMGTLAMRATTSGLFQKFMRWAAPDFKRDLTPKLIQYDLSIPVLDVVLVGMRSPEEVAANVALVDDSDRLDLETFYRPHVE